MQLFAAMKLATLFTTLLAGLVEGVAVFSVLEIGPNLLAAVTSIIGAVVLVIQLKMAGHVRETKKIVRDSNRELKEQFKESDGE